MHERPEFAGDGTGTKRFDASAPSVLVFDVLGEIFDRLRELDLPCALWRILDPSRVSSDVEFRLVVCAGYGPPNWDVVAELQERAPALIITTAYQRAEVEEALRRDLIGYLDAGIERAVLDRAMRGALVRGEAAFPRDAIGAWMRERRSASLARYGDGAGLTRRQRQVVSLIATGATDKEIASSLGIAATTTQKHVTNILRRLRVPNRAAAVAVFAGARGAWQAPAGST